MPEIRPFRGLYYNPHKIKKLARVVTEPYDVINPAQQAAYYRLHPYNVIRLILGKRWLADNSKNNQYTRAKKYFADWQKQKILLKEDKENIYILAQSFHHNNKIRTRTGFIALLKLADFSKDTILPHENTNSSAVQDRLNLLKACSANLSPIFTLFCDPQRKVNQLLNQCKINRRPDMVVEKDGVLHQLWRVSDQRRISAVQKLLRDKQIFIADGHHRYEAALNYQAYNYLMTYLVATADPGLAILPTHRVLKLPAHLRPQRIIHELKDYFTVRRFSTSEALFADMGQSRFSRFIFGLYLKKNKFYGLKLKDAVIADKLSPPSGRGGSSGLDVTILHALIIERILKLVPSGDDIYYTRDVQEAIRLVDAGKYQISFFLKPATVSQVKRAAQAGEKMPHKSTYFYPKLLTGLVINTF